MSAPEVHIDRERIRSDIVDMIVGGDLTLNDPTTEAAILGKVAERMAAVDPSRLHGALSLLLMNGMLDPVPQVGVKLRPVTAAEIKAIISRRGRLEGLVVEALAEMYPDPALIEVIRAHFEGNIALAARDVAGFAKWDSSFHRELALAAGYDTGARSLLEWTDRVRVFLAQNPPSLRKMRQIGDDQRRILDAICSKDPLRAANAMAKHLQRLETMVGSVAQLG